MTDPFDAAVDATRRLLAIHEAADGRPLTNAQKRDYRPILAELESALDQIPGGVDTYILALRTQMDKTDDKRPYVAEMHRMLGVQGRLAGGDDLIDHINEANRMSANPAADGKRLQAAFLEARAGHTETFDSPISAKFLEARALATTTATMFPTTVADFVTVYQRTLSPLLDPNVTTVLSTATGAPIALPRVTADVSTGGTVTAENAAVTVHDPTVSSVTLGAFGFKSITLWSNELDTDEVVGLRQLIAEANARPISIDEGTMLTTGTGTVQPWGIVTRATNGGTASGTATYGASATFFGWGDLSTLMYSVAAPYRKSGSFMVSTDAYSKIATFRDNNNQPVLVQGGGGLPDTLFGRPIYENPAMAAVASATKSVLFGDLSKYVVRRVNPMRITVSPDAYFGTDQTAVRVVDRLDGDLIDVNAVAYLVSANT